MASCAYRSRKSLDRQWRAAKQAILAYHIGSWRKGESPLEALARALDAVPENLLTALVNHSTDGAEFDLLSSCLGASRLDLSGLSIQDGIVLIVALTNKKLVQVPAEVRAYFGAPEKLKPFPRVPPTPRLSRAAQGSMQ